MKGRTIRVFLSSTFKDMKRERDALHGDRVQGALRRLCEESGFQFQLIDLRWGVSEEASLDQRTEDLCIREIERCQNVTPRPNFVALIGQRYGWCPLPVLLEPSDWDVLVEASPDAETLQLLRNWYQVDANNRPEMYRLRPRKGERESDAAFWHHHVERPLLDYMLDAINDTAVASRLSAGLINSVGVSLTEKEIRAGAENAEKSDWAAFAYFRDIPEYPDSELPELFRDETSPGRPTTSGTRSQRLSNLRRRLEDNPSVRVRKDNARVVFGALDNEYIERLCAHVYDDLSAAINTQIGEMLSWEKTEWEQAEHAAFCDERRKHYVSRSGEKEQLANRLALAMDAPLVIEGASGSGKTAFMAMMEERVLAQYPAAVVIKRFIGATGESARLGSLIVSVYEEAARRTGHEADTASSEQEPGFWLLQALEFGRPEQPVVVILDGLDQLNDEPDARSSQWVPKEIPDASRLILSCLSPGGDEAHRVYEVYRTLRSRFDDERFYALPSHQISDAVQIFQDWLASYGRKVTAAQYSLVTAVIRKNPNPLYVRVLVELARPWPSTYIPESVPEDVPGAIAALLEHLEQPETHGRRLVERTLSWLVLSRSGLSEAELVGLMWEDPEIYDRFVGASRVAYPGGSGEIPPAVWSRLLFDLDTFLQDRIVNSIGVIGFYHRQLAETVAQRYVSENATRRDHIEQLIDYFEDQPVWASRDSNVSNTRRAYELPFHLLAHSSEDAQNRLRKFLTDKSCVEAKIAAGLKDDLITNYGEAVSSYPGIEDELVEFFRDQLLEEGGVFSSRLQLDDVHSLLVYRADGGGKEFYRKVLESLLVYGPDDDNSAHIARLWGRAHVDLAGLERREGHHDRARRLLTVVTGTGDHLTLSARAKGWYELAYIDYLEGKFSMARDRFRQSVEDSNAAGDHVGAAISSTLEAWNAYFARPDDANLLGIWKTVSDALDVFRAASKSDPRAIRWVMSGVAHLASWAYLKGDVKELERYVGELGSDPWIRQFGDPGAMQDYHARLAHLRGHAEEAVALWQERFDRDEDWRASQNVAWRLADYAESLLLLGHTIAGVAVLQGALGEPEWRGNTFWQGRARERLKRISLTNRALAAVYRLVCPGKTRFRKAD